MLCNTYTCYFYEHMCLCVYDIHIERFIWIYIYILYIQTLCASGQSESKKLGRSFEALSWCFLSHSHVECCQSCGHQINQGFCNLDSNSDSKHHEIGKLNVTPTKKTHPRHPIFQSYHFALRRREGADGMALSPLPFLIWTRSFNTIH